MQKFYKIIIIGNSIENFQIAENLVSSNLFNVIAGIVDYNYPKAISSKQRNFLVKHNIKEISFADIKDLSPDICLSLSYTRKIDLNYLSGCKCLNIHGAILPKWRGFSSLCWALLNGENKIGQTLHVVDEELDNGDIVKVFSIDYDLSYPFYEARLKINEKVAKELPQVLYDYLQNKIEPISQKDKLCAYTAKIRFEDSIIKDWNRSSDYFYRLYRIFQKPYGTGLLFEHKNQLYEISELKIFYRSANYNMVSGAVVNSSADSIFVKTSDSVVELKGIKPKDKNEYCSFKIGTRLSEN